MVDDPTTTAGQLAAATTGTDLDRFTLRVLRLVAESSPIGLVRLADYVWVDREVPTYWIMPLEEAIRTLGDLGLVVYTLGYSHGYVHWDEAIRDIRITRDGLLAAGFPERHRLVQKQPMARREFIAPDPSAIWVDWTRYWHHGYHAVGSVITREALAVHRRLFPDHRHGSDFDPAEGGTLMSRGFRHITEETKAEIRHLADGGTPIRELVERFGLSETSTRLYAGKKGPLPREAEVLALVAEGVKQAEIARRLGMGTGAVSEVIRNARVGGRLNGVAHEEPLTIGEAEGKEMIQVSAEDIARAPDGLESSLVAATITGESLRTRILKAVALGGPWPDTMALVGALQRPGSPGLNGHEVQSILQKSLHRQGLVKFVVRKTGGNQKNLENIEATAAGFRAIGLVPPAPVKPRYPSKRHPVGRDATDPTAHGPKAVGGPVERIKVLDVHEHDTANWRADCSACKVYHPTGQPHAAAFPPVESAFAPVVAELDRLYALDAKAAAPTDGFPFLDALRARVAAKAAASRTSEKYLAAAALLEGINDEERDHLLNLAEAAEGEPFSALETEYLRFADR